jgi:hypothetical protein
MSSKDDDKNLACAQRLAEDAQRLCRQARAGPNVRRTEP